MSINVIYKVSRTKISKNACRETKYFSVIVDVYQSSDLNAYLFSLIINEMAKDNIQSEVLWCMMFATQSLKMRMLDVWRGETK